MRSSDLYRAQQDEIRFLRRQVEELQAKLLYLVGKPYDVPPIELHTPKIEDVDEIFDPLIEVLD